MKRILFAVGALALIVLVVLMAIFLRSRLFSSSQITQTDGLEISPTAQLYPFGSEFLAVDGGEMTFYDAAGKAKKTFAIPTGSDVLLSTAGKSVPVYHDEFLSVYEQSLAEPFTKELNIAMSDIKCSPTLDYMALLNDERDAIYLLNDKRSKIDELHFTGQTVVSMGWFHAQTRDLLWVVFIDNSGSSPVSVVGVYEAGKNNIALKEFTDQVVYNVVINTASVSPLAIGTRTISGINISASAETDSISALVYGYQYVAASDNGNVILLAPPAEIAKNHITSLRIVNGNSAVNVQLPSGCSAFCVGSKNIYAADAASVYTIGFDGEIKSVKNFDALYNSVKTIGNSKMMFFSSTSATLVKLPD